MQASVLLLSLPGASEWVLIFLVIALIPAIFYLLTLQNTLQAISIENRKMPPANVWLMLIPFFNVVWQFIMVSKISDSIKAESYVKNFMVDEERPAYGIGLAMCILQCTTIIPGIGSYLSIAGVVCWIVYWSKIAAYKNRIQTATLNDDNSGDLIRL